jgi:hypothetical protein
MRDVCSKVAVVKRQFRGSAIVAFAALAVAAAGCLAGPQDSAEPEVQATQNALTTVNGGSKYLGECQANHVPSPPPWGPTALGKWTDVGMSVGSLNGQDPGHIYLWIQGTGTNAGICILLTRSGGGPAGSIDIICQSQNYGSACFYEGGYPDAFPTTQSFPNSVVKGGADLGVRCTDCHAGENVFITHHGSVNDALNLNGSSGWMPSVWYKPLVAPGMLQNPGPETTLPAATLTGTPGNNTPCLTCHVQGGPGGRFPLLGTTAFAGNYCSILFGATNRPGSKGGMPPGNTCTPDSNCAAQKDPFTKAILAQCGAGTPPPPPAVRINAGDNNGIGPFVGDKLYSGGAQKSRVNNSPPIYIDVTGVDDPAPLNLYLTQRYGSPFSYTIGGFAANSTHKIRLHFAETNPLNNAAGKRKFTVTINGYPQIKDLDLFVTAGGLNKAYIFDCTINADSGGKFVFQFTHTIDSATISGIEVL